MFKVVFQNGEFSSDQSAFLGISIDTIFTVFTTIAIFIAGYYVNRMIEIRKEKRRLTELEEYFRELIALLEKPLLKQKESYLKFSKKIKEKKEQHLYLDDVVDFKVDQIKEIDNKDLYTIFIKNKKGETATKTDLFKKLRGAIDFADNAKLEIEKGFNNLISYQGRFFSNYKTNIKTISELFETFLSENIRRGVLPQQDPFLMEFNRIRNDWIQSGDKGVNYMDMFIAKENYIDNIRELCASNMQDPRSNFLLKPIMECVYAYHDIIEMKHVYRRLFLLEARGLQKSMFDMKSTIGKFDNIEAQSKL